MNAYRFLRFLVLGGLMLLVIQPLHSQDNITDQPGTVPLPDPTPATYLPGILQPRSLYLPVMLEPEPSLINTSWPMDGATEQSPNVYLTWQVALTDTNSFQYEVYLTADLNAAEALISPPGLSANHLDPTTFEVDTQYYWRVIAFAPDGRRLEGPLWTFRTEALSDPPDVEKMVNVPAGEFKMGCDRQNPGSRGCSYKDTPLHAVYLDSFAVDKYEVTNRQYRECVNAGKCSAPRKFRSSFHPDYFTNPDYDYYPVLYVSWWDGGNYCAWKDKRLPTEAEWEKAARGAIDTRAWPWGDEFSDCSRLNNTNDSNDDHWIVCVGDTTQVGSYPRGASPYGAMDMSGNAFEWVADLYNEYYYHVSPYENPTGPSGDKKVKTHPAFTLRGGSYRARWSYPRVFHRHFGHHGDGVGDDSPYFRNNQVGFRCARSLPDQP